MNGTICSHTIQLCYKSFHATLTRQVSDMLFFWNSDLKVPTSYVNADKQFHLQKKKKFTSAFLKLCHLHMQNMNLYAIL
jgi:hypothetical protein